MENADKNTQMRIALVCNYTLNPNRIGGMDRFYVAYDQRLKALGYQVDWYFTDYVPFDFFSRLTIFSANHQNVETFFLETIKQKQIQYDILITHFVALCTVFFKNAKATGIQYTIAVDHNPRPLEGFPISKRIKNRLKGILYSKYINSFVGVSNYTTQHILKDYGFFLRSKTQTVYNGIDTSVFKKRESENRNQFFVASHLRPSKGIQDLLQALSELDENIKSQIQIDIYGEGPMENELKAIATKHNLNETVHFKGSSSQLNELAANYSYLIQPTYMECFSLSILESLAANVPVITTTVGGNLEIIRDSENGFIFEPKAYWSLAGILSNIVSGTLKIDQDVSLQIEKDFNLKKMVDEHIRLLN